MDKIFSRTEQKIFIKGSLLLVAGLVVYLLFRPSSIFYLNLSIFSDNLNLPGFVLGSSPSFLHTMSFIFISSIFVERNRKNIVLLSSSWILIEIFFEVGQIFHFSRVGGFLFLSYFTDYFNHGVFDINDVFASVSGGILAMTVLYPGRNIVKSKDYKEGKG